MSLSKDADPLDAMAPLLRVRPHLDLLCRFGGAWASPHAADRNGWAQFHIVTRGECLVERAGEPSILLEAGDILLLPSGDPHIVRARRGRSLESSKIITEIRNAIRVRAVSDVEIDTELVCGRLQFEIASPSLLVAALPSTIVIRASDWPEADRSQSLLEIIRDELDGDRSGAREIATNMASALFVMMLRAHMGRSGGTQGVLQLLTDRLTSKAVLAMLREPAVEWTLDALADRAVTSRATLVRRFRTVSGMAPLAFLTDLRLSLAKQRIMASNTPLAEIAVDIGYQSEGALSRAIQRHFGRRPSEFRRTATARAGTGTVGTVGAAAA
jgi:AraC family transcriptional regulator, activator of mtrCDE